MSYTRNAADLSYGLQDLAPENPPVVGIEAFADSGVNIEVLVWGASARRYQVCNEVNARVFKALGKAGVEIPFPQREVPMLGEAA